MHVSLNISYTKIEFVRLVFSKNKKYKSPSPEDKIKFEELMESESDCKGKYNQINSLVKNKKAPWIE